MTRTLHLVDQPGPTAEAAVLRLSIDAAKQDPSSKHRHAWLLFGAEATRDAARAMGLRDSQFVLLPRPTGLHTLLPRSLAKPRRLMSQAHRVACWTDGAAQIASLTGCAHAARCVHRATLSRFAQRTIVRACVDDPPESDQSTREALRRRWGVEPGTTVVALLGDRFDRIDAGALMMTMATTHEALGAKMPSAADVRLLCHPMTKGRAEAGELCRLLSMDQLLIQDEAIALPWSVLAGCDVGLVALPSEAGLSMLWAEAMGVPMIVPRDPGQPLLNELDQVVPGRSRKPSDLADALTQWATHRSQPAAR